ncbi:MAG TPA: Maf family protein [Candidatus Goldiibacteriota bacterium]|nr:Maf family protein [Candidatus Goldiibacteriota bacterium]
MKKKLFLASTSPRRISLLKEHGIKFKKIKPEADEKSIERRMSGYDPVLIAQRLAYEKAFSVINKVKDGVILGADTIVVYNGVILGKPSGIAVAKRTLSRLSGSTHRVITGIAMIDARSKTTILDAGISYVTFKKLTSAEINAYVINNNVMDKAGAYAIQEGADPFVKSIKGSYYNIVGLPLELVKKRLASF